MKVAGTVAELKRLISSFKEEGKTIGLVPTMGALHQGHLSLVERAVKENDATVVSIFVNPTQFNNPADLATYPRTEENDLALLEKAGVDVAFVPSVEEVYPEKDDRVFDLGQVAEVMEGPMRPGHFNGVAQIVSRLFEWAQPDRAYFGEKDYQQIAVIRRLVEIMNASVIIVDCPINREPNGLARSSRNVRLTAEQLQIAPTIYATLRESKKWKEDGLSPAQVIEKVTSTLNGVPQLQVEYYQIVDSKTLQPVDNWPDGGNFAVGCITVYCGEVRLIDNIKYIN